MAIALKSCSSKESHLESINNAPEFSIKAYNDTEGEYTSEVKDSLRIPENSFYKLKYKLNDEAESLHKIKVNYNFIKGYGAFNVDATNNIINYTPDGVGEHIVEIQVKDNYNKMVVVSLELIVYDNLPPVPHLTFEKIDQNYRVNASKSYDPDGRIVNYHFDYGVKTIDIHENDNLQPVVDIWADHVEQNGGVTLTLTDEKGMKSEPRFFEL